MNEVTGGEETVAIGVGAGGETHTGLLDDDWTEDWALHMSAGRSQIQNLASGTVFIPNQDNLLKRPPRPSI